ncbi:flagellar export protein FliJ [Leptospira wolffii]|uniref:flagellar export protein FliJ n=1 Tax=Leptospira wolffii TaxID=409998 RepID=UPI0002F8F6AA|nr:flagellar export protein FliJ [Leptospira wolffii]EPG68046.1 flagellar export protein FliJ [Leptospira wolffii serovar Khorat str. Khorat-H2]
MKKFRFRLEPILRLKKIQEDKKLKELSELVAEVNRRQSEIDGNESKIQNLSATSLTGTADLREYSYLQTYVRQLLTRNGELQTEIRSFDEPVEKKRAEVSEARKEKKVIELLKENRFREYMHSYRKTERIQAEEQFLAELYREQREEIHGDDRSKRDPKIFTYDTGSVERTGTEDAGLSELRKLYERYKK